MIVLIFLAALATVISPIAFLIGLFKVLFQKDDREFGIKLIIYGAVSFVIGFGTCTAIPLNGHL